MAKAASGYMDDAPTQSEIEDEEPRFDAPGALAVYLSLYLSPSR
jgi:hypothetical protein